MAASRAVTQRQAETRPGVDRTRRLPEFSSFDRMCYTSGSKCSQGRRQVFIPGRLRRDIYPSNLARRHHPNPAWCLYPQQFHPTVQNTCTLCTPRERTACGDRKSRVRFARNGGGMSTLYSCRTTICPAATAFVERASPSRQRSAAFSLESLGSRGHRVRFHF